MDSRPESTGTRPWPSPSSRARAVRIVSAHCVGSFGPFVLRAIRSRSGMSTTTFEVHCLRATRQSDFVSISAFFSLANLPDRLRP
jgi:hypothetical protein